MYKSLGRKRIKKKNHIVNNMFTILLGSIFLFFAVYITTALLEERVLPTVLKISDIQAKVLVNKAIDNAVKNTLNGKNITSGDFLSQQTDENGRVNILSANTVLINEICSQVAVEVSDELYELDEQEIVLHSGIFTGIKLLENKGPKLTFSIKPKGTAIVNYNTHFESAGINQINFQVYLDIVANLTLVAPFKDNDIEVKRNVVLVNTVLNGGIPNNIYPGNLYAPQR